MIYMKKELRFFKYPTNFCHSDEPLNALVS